MTKIVFLVDQLYKHGGIERLVAIKSNYWTENFSYDVSVLSTDNKDNTLAYNLNKRVKIRDLKINYQEGISFFNPKNLLKLIRNTYLIQKYIFRYKPDFIVVASHIPITYLLPFLLKGKTKIIKEIHYTKFYEKANLKQKLFKKIESLYDKIVVLSQEELLLNDLKNSIVIPNPIANNVNRVAKSVQQENVAVMILRFAPVKRIELAIDIWKVLIEKGVNWHLHIYGNSNNEYAKQIQNKIQELGLEKQIVLKGVSNDINSVLSKAKITVLTSSQECFPMVILESFANAVPVIALDVPTGPRNIIVNNKNGLLVKNKVNFVDNFIVFTKNSTLQDKLALGALASSKEYNIHTIMNLWKTKIFDTDDTLY